MAIMDQICRSRQQVTNAHPRAIVPKVIDRNHWTQAREATRDCNPNPCLVVHPIEAEVRHQALGVIERMIRGEQDAAWYGRELPHAIAHARILRRRISRHPIRGPS